MTTAPAPAPRDDVVEDTGARRHALTVAGLCIAAGLAAVVLFGLTATSDQVSTMLMNPRGVDTIPDIELPTQIAAFVLGFGAIALGVRALQVADPKITVFFGGALGLFALALVIWAARDGTGAFYGLIAGSVQRATPIALGAIAGLLCERTGVINIAIEGMMLAAAFGAAITASATGSLWIGLLCGILTGALFGAIHAVISIRYEVDQIVGGTFINIFALGLTSYLTVRVLVEYSHLNQPGTFRPFEIPLLVEIPFLGPLLFSQNIFGFIMFGLVAFLAWALFNTRWGLRVRSVGEHPRAADTVGISVRFIRYRNVILGGMVAGLGGAWFTLGSAGRFDQNMTNGKGFIALAAMIFGRWHPVGALIAALIFGFSEQLNDYLALLDTPIPSEFLLMAPYVVTIVVVAGLVGRPRVPAANGQVYRSGG
ncbi:MAG TPA: ABC transporter permease [Acidimicrobiales bacterium]|nr:ABC transporter permease [Acidimicrobiales bacterium]